MAKQLSQGTAPPSNAGQQTSRSPAGCPPPHSASARPGPAWLVPRAGGRRDRWRSLHGPPAGGTGRRAGGGGCRGATLWAGAGSPQDGAGPRRATASQSSHSGMVGGAAALQGWGGGEGVGLVRGGPVPSLTNTRSSESTPLIQSGEGNGVHGGRKPHSMSLI